MTETEETRPWEELERLVAESSPRAVEEFLEALPAGEAARAVSRLSDDDQSRLLTTLAPEDAAELVEQLPDAQAVEMVERLAPDDAARIVQELPSDEQADLLGDLSAAGAEAIFARLDPAESRELRALCDYPDDVAGGLMETEYLAFPVRATVAEVVDQIRQRADELEDYAVQYAYVIDEGGRLCGVLRLRDLLIARGARPIEALMIRSPLALRDQASLEELRDFFERHALLGVPVLGPDDRLLGIVQRASVEEAQSEQLAQETRLARGIVGGEELRTLPILLRARRRLAWLSVNIVLNVAAASVIAVYQDTLAAAIALAVFLPIISDMSGCSGNQAVAVSLRELTLGLVRPHELFLVWRKEVVVGLINGLCLGGLIAAVALLWKGNVWLAAVVGGALAANTVIAVSIGGAVPLVLRRLGVDPALASGPVLTTVTDICGFLLLLGMASAAMAGISGS